mmetsp:Transcript_17091/g.38455  ORF Transcript_17091/g.38455 Transcript_17091/m.38455 type:complete len:564 (-) Transcript_17091:89-1780(-)|eukprot:CAMPEP_0113308956 /NCGR_PEP_ID=MMETSP0010_2-20120614/7199_1 /TAXON_ID=216773 ORGANISM="Corethron hystrix, Strain 308" /NCGR_SAMPLE_ID=MMETSP0010_2 /ASSEMBLY_ACC=CAM_ASM_000155 /LENGTH=563 /DNA_ID=CAMNT_0000164125 /DNA_START=138 /DNA_END=1829 /DNA_ORIENTATION=+ /assembly_acc=CAM_ASM_000155
MTPSRRHFSGFFLLTFNLAVNWCQVDGFGTFVDMTEKSRAKDEVPVLGRGYSSGTGIYYSKCLRTVIPEDDDGDADEILADATRSASFDYDYSLVKIQIGTSESSTGADTKSLVKAFSDTASLGAALQAVEDSKDKNKNSSEGEMKLQLMFALMSIDKYSVSLREDFVDLDVNVIALLKRNDFTGAIQVCGPQFIRSIRRTAEVLGIFTYLSVDGPEDEVDLFQETLEEDLEGVSKEDDKEEEGAKSFATFSSLIIKITGYGLDLSVGKGSLIAESLGDYSDVMESAFSMMLNPHTGLIKSIELVPWSSNIHWQAASGLDTTLVYSSGSSEKRLPSSIKQLNYMANSEHIVEMDAIAKYKFNMLSSLSQCVQQLWKMSEPMLCNSYVSHRQTPFNSEHYNGMRSWLYDQRGMDLRIQNEQHFWRMDDEEQYVIQAYRLKYLLDGYAESTDQQTTLIEKLTTVYSYWINEYLGRCMKALTADIKGVRSGTIFFTHWASLPECYKPSCLFESAYWSADDNRCTLRRTIDTHWEKLVDGFCGLDLGYDRTLQWGDQCEISLDSIYG